MAQKITIPQQNQPFRRQSSLGGNVSFRNLGGTDDNNYVVMAIVTKVYYKQGRVDFKLTNSTNHVVTESGDGIGSAPIPVDFYGYQRNGKIFGHYRPIQVGDLIAVAYLWGHKQAPIVLGVYPKNSSSYEFVAPQDALSSGDDKDEATYDYALGDQKIFPDGSLEYHSGNGKYFKTLRGKSFMLLDDSPLYDHLWLGYNDIGAFKNSDQKVIHPLQEEAGDWLLVHEDNNEDTDSTDHRTRFYVKKDGTFQVVLSKSSSLDNLVILEGSKSEGFTLQQLYNVPQSGWIGENDPHKDPDLENAQQYVKFNIGGPDHSATVEAATKDDSVEQATKLEIKDDGIYVNGKVLVSSNPEYTGKTIVDDAINTSEGLNDAINEASAAAESARQAGEIAKQAGISAEAAGESAKNTGDDIKKRIIYYASISNEKDIAIPGKYIIVNTDTYIANGTIKNAYIEDGAIDHAKIADEAVGSSQIEDLAVTRAKIAEAAIGSAQIEDLAVTDAKVGKLTFDHMAGATLDASQINVINLKADSIVAGTITADKLNIKNLSDITSNAGTINQGTIQAGDDPTKGVVISDLDADNPDKYTPAKKAFLLSEVQKLNSAAEAAIDYGKSTGVDCSAVQTAKQAMDDGLAPLLSDMAATTEFDYNTVIKLEQDLQSAISAFHSASNSDIMSKIGKTADGKNTIYRGADDPTTAGEQPNLNDIWLQILNDGTYNIRVWDGAQWINPGLADIKAVKNSLSGLPKSYYQTEEPVGSTVHDGDTWYKLTKGSDGNYTYTPYKFENNQWVLMLDATSSRNYVGSAPASPLEGDFWMDNTTLKQYQSGKWVVVPTKGDQGVPGTPGTDGKTYYTWIKYATDSSGSNMSDSPTGMSYIGIAYNKESSTESSTATDYKWSLIKGADGKEGPQGIQGPAGADGKTSYLHIAYANSADGKTGFTTSPDTKISYNYMGTYTDYTQAGSTDPSSYKWVAMFDSTKKRNFTTQPTTPYAVGDTWTESGFTKFCTNSRDSGAFDANDWTMQQLTIQALDPSVANSLYNDNLSTGTDQEYVMGYGIPNTTWQDGYAYEKLPTTVLNGGEILPQGSYIFFYTLTKGTTYTQTIWFETDATVKDLNAAQITWHTNGAGHDIQPATLIKLGENKYKLYSTYTWPGKSDNSVRLFDIEYLNSTFDLTTGTYLKFGKLKLEKGNVSTDWCLSQSELTTTTGNYKGVTLNDAGLTATAGSTTVAMNSTDGFLINNASEEAFHVDNSGNLTMKGKITGGDISGVNFTGDNLTLAGGLAVNGGHILLGDGTATLDSKGLSLKGGGLSISDTSGNQTTYIEQDGTFFTNKGVFSGDVTANKLILTGNTSDINMGGGVFHVDSQGNVTANNFTSNNVKITGGLLDAGGVNITNINADNITAGTLSGQYLEINGDTKISGVLNVPEVKLQGKSGMIGLDGSNGITISSADTLFQTRVTQYGMDYLNTTNGVKRILGGITTGFSESGNSANGISIVLDTKQKLGDPYGGDFFSIGTTTSIDNKDNRTWNRAMDYDASGTLHGGGFSFYEKVNFLGGINVSPWTTIGLNENSNQHTQDPLILTSYKFTDSTQSYYYQPALLVGYNSDSHADSGISFLWDSVKLFGTLDLDGTNIRMAGTDGTFQFGSVHWSDWTDSTPALFRLCNGHPAGIAVGSDGNVILFSPSKRWDINAKG